MLKPYSPEVKEEKAIDVDEELLAELDEYTGMTAFIDEFNEHLNLPLIMRQKLESYVHRRKVPHAPYVKLPKYGTLTHDPVQHVEFHPYKSEEPQCDKVFP
jgi:hypothetical protein